MTHSTGPIVSTSWLSEHINDPDVVVIDVRPGQAYTAAHLPRAISVDLAPARLGSSTPSAVTAWQARLQELVQAAGITPQQTVVFYEDVSGTMAPYGVWLLDAAGLSNGAMLDGGIRGWHAAGLPLTQEPGSVARSETTISPQTAPVGTLDGISASINDAASTDQFVDARTINEHEAGAIPGAIHVDWTTHLDPATGAFRPMEELAALYDGAGLDLSAPATSYCAGGFRAANTYVVLKALGVAQAANYAPSWGEWGMHPDTPKG
jgi:thiosulfate/3-mercaptopyruvate sulfurtransferase